MDPSDPLYQTDPCTPLDLLFPFDPSDPSHPAHPWGHKRAADTVEVGGEADMEADTVTLTADIQEGTVVVAGTEVAEDAEEDSGMVATHRVLDRVNCIDRDKTYLTTNVVV